MAAQTLLVELLTEELPPKALPRLGKTFGERIRAGLLARGLCSEAAAWRVFASPRRLAVRIAGVLDQAPAQEVTEKIMPVAIALDAEGNPTEALRKKLQGKGLSLDVVKHFERRMDGKAEALFYTTTVPGAALAAALSDVVQEAIKALPIPKVMHWGDGEATFVRPVHHLTFLHGDQVVPGRVLDLEAGRVTQGHRFMSPGDITLNHADHYESTLLETGKVIPHFGDRRARIDQQLREAAEQQKAQLGEYADLLDEVTALVEHPTVYVGAFEPVFLAVPQECLILTMRANQKYFPLFDAQGKLLNRFLIVSNMELADPSNIITGNQRVVRPRLADARFFYEQDSKQKLETRLPRLANVVFHNKLGSMLERVERLERLAGRIAERLGANVDHARRAARLAKADLGSEMVGEFPELQGIMGRYYAAQDGEAAEVAQTVEDHYRPRFAGDALPSTQVGAAVALADKLDALVGFFGIGQIPTGDKDPFGLRRAALGVLRILMETPLPLDLRLLISDAATGFEAGLLTADGYEAQLLQFMLERLRHLLREAHSEDGAAIDAVLALTPVRIDLVPAQLAAVKTFAKLPEAQSLAAANKRITNILKKVDGPLTETVQAEKFEAPAEKTLAAQMQALQPTVEAHLAAGRYTEGLCALAALRAPVDTFFDEVMVMAEDPAVRANRLALLKQLADLMNQVADLSRLAVS